MRKILVFKRWFIVIMTLLIATQSMVAVADIYQLSHDSIHHLRTHQPTDASNDISIFKQTPEKSDQAAYDCHRFCHGHSYMALMSAPLSLTLSLGAGLIDYQASLTSIALTPPFRPPIG
ncbi:MAG: hypothetical protein CML19_01920 [Pusillimonas sp.]|nr:hypothetical protein [Pusillimonas sp.]|tara:strand:- start:85160 stop:85516 length:357 start_codon:yes stop_codon:yes gene_type:complete